MVHIGPGAFHRAHQAVYTETAGWQIEGISLRSTDVADALNAQDGRYTLVVRGDGGTEYKVVTALTGVLAAARGLAPVQAALTRPETQIVSLTVTEKAYRAGEPVIDLLVHALVQRRADGTPPFTLMSCDNLSGNGAVLRDVVLDHARGQDAGLADWIADQARFPSTMVDRITPATTPALLEEVAHETGWADQAPVETEAFSQWVIEDNFVGARPDWALGGAQVVADVAPYEHMKLRMLNGAHSMLAYAGHVAGKAYVRDVMADPGLSRLVARHMDAAAATLEPGLDVVAYRDALLARFGNPHLAHETYQIATDGSQKLPQRIFAPALAAMGCGQDLGPFAFAVAAWLRYLTGRTDGGMAYAIRDPRRGELENLPVEPRARVEAAFALSNLVPPKLAASDTFHDAVTARLATMSGSMDAAILAET